MNTRPFSTTVSNISQYLLVLGSLDLDQRYWIHVAQQLLVTLEQRVGSITSLLP
jgi:hypothetical protein